MPLNRLLSCAGAVALFATSTAGQSDRHVPVGVERVGSIFFLDISRGGRVLLADGDGREVVTVAASLGAGPDGIVVDRSAAPNGRTPGRLYWTTMGRVSTDSGTIEGADLDGRNQQTLVPQGSTFTPKQIKLDDSNRIYWADREGMRIMRARRDGSNVETLIETGRGDEDRRDARNWCVGIALDLARRQVYWTQKGSGGNGRIFRAGMDVPPGQTPANRTDIETLFDGLPEPIDLAIDGSTRQMYWTDRGDPPRGNTVNRAPMDPPPGADPSHRTDVRILFGGLREGIGIALDPVNQRLFATDLGGNVYRAALDGSRHETILTGQGTLTGIAYTELRREWILQGRSGTGR